MSELSIYFKYVFNKSIRYIEVILPLFIVVNYNFYPLCGHYVACHLNYK